MRERVMRESVCVMREREREREKFVQHEFVLSVQVPQSTGKHSPATHPTTETCDNHYLLQKSKVSGATSSISLVLSGLHVIIRDLS